MTLFKQDNPFTRHRLPAAIALAVIASIVANQPVQAQTSAAPPATNAATAVTPTAADIASVPKGWFGDQRERIVVAPPRDMTVAELAIVERASARRRLLDKGEYKAAYEYLSPASRSFKSIASFESEAAASVLRNVKATRAECDKDGRCSVTLIATAVMQQPRVGEMAVPISLQEVWASQASGEAQLILR
jgi:hypothetical protein